MGPVTGVGPARGFLCDARQVASGAIPPLMRQGNGPAPEGLDPSLCHALPVSHRGTVGPPGRSCFQPANTRGLLGGPAGSAASVCKPGPAQAPQLGVETAFHRLDLAKRATSLPAGCVCGRGVRWRGSPRLSALRVPLGIIRNQLPSLILQMETLEPREGWALA